MNKDSKIVIFGGNGLLGSAVLRDLKHKQYTNVLAPRSAELNLLDAPSVDAYLQEMQPAAIFMVAGLVGGIKGNMERPADFLAQNALMILHVLEAARKNSPASKIIYTGSTCIYPKENPQPISEDRFLQGPLEESNKGYAMAKVMGVVACQLYRDQYNINSVCAMPTNLYGPNDNYDLENGHFIPAVIKKFMDGREKGTDLMFWGTGTPRREALYSDDCADALVYLMENYNGRDIVNIGTDFDYSIKEFIETTSRIVGYSNEISWDTSKPDGTMIKRTDIARLRSIYPEYTPRSFEEGLTALLSDSDQVKRILEK
jgi:GDP-L-fucose synthase